MLFLLISFPEMNPFPEEEKAREHSLMIYLAWLISLLFLSYHSERLS